MERERKRSPTTFEGESATVHIYGDVVEKVFRKPSHRTMYEAERDALRRCESFGFTPLLLSADDASRSLLIQRVGNCDALDWMLQYGYHPSAKIALLEAAKTMRRSLMVLHAHRMYHGDFKLENTIFEYADADPYTINRVYLIDFANSSFLNKGDPSRRLDGINSVAYSSPESVRRTERSSVRDDVWGFVVCLFVWMTGSPMYDRESGDWYTHFMLWYDEDTPEYWTNFDLHCNVHYKSAALLKKWLTALKNDVDSAEFPSEEDLECLFDPDPFGRA
jgi:serine/threonine protein kinase